MSLPQDDRFPIKKYALLRKRIADSSLFRPQDFCIPHAATAAEITRAHDPDYVRRVQNGELSVREIVIPLIFCQNLLSASPSSLPGSGK